MGAAFTVFGAGGWIGSALTGHFTSRGHQVRAITRADWPPPGEALGHVIYAIGLTADFRGRPLATAEAHVSKMLQVLDSYRYDSFLYLSTTRVYKNAASGDEDAVLCVSPANPDDVYDITKLAGEAVCLSLQRPTVRVGRLSNVIGLGDSSKNFVPAVIAEAKSKRSVTIRQSPDSEKDYIFLDDVTEIIESIALRGQRRLYNVASGHNITHRQFADFIRKHTGAKVDFAAGGTRYVFPPIVVDRIRAEFGARNIPFESSLVRILREYETLRH
jgi:nucleoside-diphosphate-sugar epimerase